MIKKDIKYTDLDGNEMTQTYWFQITQADFVKRAMTEGGEAYLEKLKSITELTEEDMARGGGKLVMDTFEAILADAVGRREGNLFIKDEDIRKQFMFSGAYDSFFMELILEPDSGAAFMRDVLPKNTHAAIDQALAEAQGKNAQGPDVPKMSEPTPFPQSLKDAIEANNTPELVPAPPVLAKASKDDEPVWFKENRYPTQKELMGMGQSELQFAMKMKQDKAFG